MPTIAIVRQLELSAAARADIAGIWRFTRQRWDRVQADRYTDAIDAAMKALASGRMTGGDTVVAGYRYLRVASHLVFYRERDDVIRVARILHVRMDAPRHLPG